MRFTVKPSLYDDDDHNDDENQKEPSLNDDNEHNDDEEQEDVSKDFDKNDFKNRVTSLSANCCSSTSVADRKSLLHNSTSKASNNVGSLAAATDLDEEDLMFNADIIVDEYDSESGVQRTMRKTPYESALEELELSESKTESGAFGTVNSETSLASRCRKYAARQRRRLMYKDGNCNISSRNVMSRKRKYLVDIFTTLVDMRWRYNVILFTAAFVLSWFAFSVVWFLIAYVHGDTEHADDENWKSCVAHVYDYPTALLFSIESQTTIGFGYRVIEPYCVPSFIVLMIQSCFGVFQQSLVAGLIFAKLSRPKQRAHTLMFSRNAVVCKRDMQYCLLFRVGDMRKSHIIGTSIRAVMVKDRHTKEGEVIPLCQSPLDVQTETCNASDNFVFLVWPVTVLHKIHSSSPLWDISAEQLLSERFEIVVILEGVVESTGGTTQVRTSYLPSEILWGHRLAPLLTYQKENGQYRIDYTQFHSVEPVKMPECSARTFAAENRRHSKTDNDFDDHLPSYYTASAAKRSSTSATTASIPGSSRLSIIRRVKGSLQRRRNKVRRETVSSVSDATDVLPPISDVPNADDAAVVDLCDSGGSGENRTGAERTLSVDIHVSPDALKSNNNLSKFDRTISFA